MLKFHDSELESYVAVGKAKDQRNRKFIQDAIGVTNKKVEPKTNYMLGGPRGVGKTFGAMDEISKAGLPYVMLTPGETEIEFTVKLATKLYHKVIKPNQNLEEGQKRNYMIVLSDDSDDTFFRDYTTVSKWKNAFQKPNLDIGLVPNYFYSKDITSTIQRAEKAGRTEIVEALSYFREEGQLGLTIPLLDVRFLVLLNLNFDDKDFYHKTFKTKMRSAIDPVLDRFERDWVGANEKEQWGLLAYVLSTTQPFEQEGYKLTDKQKVELLVWMDQNWKRLKSTSYRMVESLAAAMINEPQYYMDTWKTQLNA